MNKPSLILAALVAGCVSDMALAESAPTRTPTPKPAAARAHDTSKSVIQNIKARDAAPTVTPTVTPTVAPKGIAGAVVPGGSVLSNRTAQTPTPDPAGNKSYYESRSNTANRGGITPTPSPGATRKSSTPEK